MPTENRWAAGDVFCPSFNEKFLLANHTCKITCKNLVLAVLWRAREVPDGL